MNAGRLGLVVVQYVPFVITNLPEGIQRTFLVLRYPVSVHCPDGVNHPFSLLEEGSIAVLRVEVTVIEQVVLVPAVCVYT